MKSAILFIVITLVMANATDRAFGESLIVEDEIVISPENANIDPIHESNPWYIQVEGALLGNDTIIIGTTDGILMHMPNNHYWIKLKDSAPLEENYTRMLENVKHHDILYRAGRITRTSNANEYTVVETMAHVPFIINLSNTDSIVFRCHHREDYFTHLVDVKPYEEIVIYNFTSGAHDTIIAVSDAAFSNYRRIYTIPFSIKRFLDSVNALTTTLSAYDPRNDAIWFAYTYYNTLYAITVDGKVVDSIPINASDYYLPKPPVSRLITDAVIRDWANKCTPIYALEYVHPGYLLLQYRRLVESGSNRSPYLFTKLVWRTDKTLVEINIDETWRLVQVQSDGRLVFVKYFYEDRRMQKVVLYIARIVA